MTAVTFALSTLLSPADGLDEALGAIRVLGVQPVEEELRPHLRTVLADIKGKSQCLLFTGVQPATEPRSPSGPRSGFGAIRGGYAFNPP